MQFHKVIKDIESRLNDSHLRLESFVVTPTPFAAVTDRGLTREQWAVRHVLFMDSDRYVDTLCKELLKP